MSANSQKRTFRRRVSRDLRLACPRFFEQGRELGVEDGLKDDALALG